MKISIIIPVVNEAENLRKLIPKLKSEYITEIIVVDGGSEDDSGEIAEELGAKVIRTLKSRAIQMNKGADIATSEVLYFVHADSVPPIDFSEVILETISENIQFGCFRSLFDTTSIFLRINSYFSRFKGLMFRGGGQTLWITKELFNKLGGYDESLKLMEEYDFIKRAGKLSDYKVIPKDVLVSTRTYDEHGNFKTQLVYAIVMFGFFRGIDQVKLISFAHRWLN